MPTNEKEYNGYLFDQLSLLEDIERVARKTGENETLEEIAYQRKKIERKLYQQLPTNEKEYNGNLFDQLTLIERIEEAAIEDGAEKTLKVIAKLKKEVERKLYQVPPLIEKE